MRSRSSLRWTGLIVVLGIPAGPVGAQETSGTATQERPQSAAPANAPARARITTSFDADWRFFKGDAPGAEQPGFSDAAWRALDVPHDWSIEGPFDPNNPTGGAGGFLPGG